MRKEFVWNRIEDPAAATPSQTAGRSELPRMQDLVGFYAVDPSGEEIGTVRCIWEDSSRQATFLGVKTGWLGLGTIHAVPSFSVELSQEPNTIRIPFSRDVVKGAPSYDVEEAMTAATEKEVYDYYSNRGMETKVESLVDTETGAPGKRD